MTSLNTGSVHVNGCRSKEKRIALFTFLAFKKSSVIFQQETHTDVFKRMERTGLAMFPL